MSGLEQIVFDITWSVMSLPREAQQMSDDLVWHITTGRVDMPMYRKLKGMKRNSLTTMFRKLGTRIRSTDDNIAMIRRYLKV